VTAINVVTGGVETKFFQNLPENKLPEGSLYAPAKEEIEPVLSGRLMEHFTDVDIYAEAVVKNALKANPQKNQYVGSNVGFVCVKHVMVYYLGKSYLLV
jgi:1-acylglycerone phosphate reductase